MANDDAINRLVHQHAHTHANESHKFFKITFSSSRISSTHCFSVLARCSAIYQFINECTAGRFGSMYIIYPNSTLLAT